MNTSQGNLGADHPGKVIPTPMSASVWGLCSRLEWDATDHRSAGGADSRYAKRHSRRGGETRRMLARILERGSQSRFEYRPADRRGRRLTRRQVDAATRQNPCRGERDSAMRSPLARRPGRAVLRRPVRLGYFRVAPTADVQTPNEILIAWPPQTLSAKLPFGCRNG